ncbi:hypothetical protein [Sphingomicrobium flavum]|uniref:hypothetical protein n=1 Tax=Sphingomicrobium flavum TaxID=1229164 RepID=UPI0021AD5857|nr:hypothetical protein [Sphingomicrobium flavum]
MFLVTLFLALTPPAPVDADPDAETMRQHAMETAAFLMERFDGNKDGILDRDEVIDAASWAKAQIETNPANKVDESSVAMADRMIAEKDGDKDGRLSRAELERTMVR